MPIASNCRTSKGASRRPTSPATIASDGRGATSSSAARSRYFKYDDLLPNDAFALSGSTWGWGIAASTNVKLGKADVLRAQLIDGAGVENYFNDAPIDVGVKKQPGNAVTPVTGEALGDFGLALFLDHTWNERFTSAVGYSRVDITNSDGQAAERLQERPVLPRQPAVHAGART